jgi:hypothetical protein
VITRTQYINKLRELGYAFSRKAKKVEVYRRSTDYHRVMIPMSKKFSDTEVGNQLRQCGCSDEDIREFLW